MLRVMVLGHILKKNDIYCIYKFKGPGLGYDIATCNKTGDIIWLKNPFLCGSCANCRIFHLGLKMGGLIQN